MASSQVMTFRPSGRRSSSASVSAERTWETKPSVKARK